jgi:hypothetical protein
MALCNCPRCRGIPGDHEWVCVRRPLHGLLILAAVVVGWGALNLLGVLQVLSSNPNSETIFLVANVSGPCAAFLAVRYAMGWPLLPEIGRDDNEAGMR